MLIHRALTEKIFHWIDKKKVLIIKGSRQVGKTTLLKEIKKTLEQKGNQIFYASIDQEFDNPIFEESKYFFRFLQDQYANSLKKKKLYVFLDEFQYLPKAGIFLKTLFDQAKDIFQIIVSGSSSLEITKNSEFLTGRKIEFFLSPLTYQEFLPYKTKLALPTKISLRKFNKLKEFYASYGKLLHRYLFEYVSFGGYPEVVTTRSKEDKITILKELIGTYIEKDIIAFLRLENITGFRNLLKILCDQIGNLVNYSELSNTTDLSMDTVRKYLDIMEGTYILDFLRPFFINIRKELSKMPKVYVNDFGLRNIVLNKISLATYISGSERENFVYHALRNCYEKENLKFYRTISQTEIDFIVDQGDMLIPLEVKSIKNSIPLPKAIKVFRDKPIKKAIGKPVIVTDDFLEITKEAYFIPLALVPFIEF